MFRAKIHRLLKFPFPLLLFLNFAFLIKVQSQEEYFVLSGKIENVEKTKDGKSSIELDYPFPLLKSKIINLKEDGSFLDTIKGSAGIYTIVDASYPFELYLRPTKSYYIKYNANHFKDGPVTLGGDDIYINNYFIEKMQKRIFIDRLNVSRSEEEFRQLLGEIRQQSLTRLENSKMPQFLKSKERKNINYGYLSELFLFLAYKKEADPNFKASAISEKELNINYLNEDDYKTDDRYAYLVDLYFEEKAQNFEHQLAQKDSLNFKSNNRIKTFVSIVTNIYIRNNLIAECAMFQLQNSIDKETFYRDFNRYYTGDDEDLKSEIRDTYFRLTKLKKGIPSPDFNFPNYSGGTNSLKDFRGKYIYIDIWATWCGNCWGEMSYLKRLEEKYKEKNIVFISISQDKFEKDWRKTIKEKNMGGVQLWAKGLNDTFFKDYAVYGIPRYIFLDPNGNIVDYNAPRPSEENKLQAIFKSVGL